VPLQAFACKKGNALLHLHLILEIGLLGLSRLGGDSTVGVGPGRIAITGLLIFGLGLTKEFLIVLEIDTGLTGAIVGDELLQTGLHTIGHRSTDEGILISDIDGMMRRGRRKPSWPVTTKEPSARS